MGGVIFDCTFFQPSWLCPYRRIALSFGELLGHNAFSRRRGKESDESGRKRHARQLLLGSAGLGDRCRTFSKRKEKQQEYIKGCSPRGHRKVGACFIRTLKCFSMNFSVSSGRGCLGSAGGRSSSCSCCAAAAAVATFPSNDSTRCRKEAAASSPKGPSTP